MSEHDASRPHGRPNLLVLVVDEMQYPRYGYGPDAGMAEPIKQILGFDGDPADNPYARFFPGFLRLRENAVVMRNHTIASSACTPSRGVLFTGQYGSRTGLTQTDGAFKSGKDPAFPWLDPAGVPTLGDWFRAAGYSTHYFGKWHISEPHDGSLEPWGFADWELSSPEPHGANPGNLGVYRDIGFTDAAVSFLGRKALGLGGDPGQPWLAVASLVNPHDIAGYPLPWFTGVETADPPLPAPQRIPAPDERSAPPPGGSLRVELNPDGFPQETFRATPTQHEDLRTKPDCHQDSALKVGLAIASRWPAQQREDAPLPYQLSQDPAGWFLANGQFYTYLHYLVDLQLRRIVDAVHQNGLAEDTLIVFTSDHGDYAGAHGGMVQKWHTAYAEALHVPLVVSSPRVNGGEAMRSVDELTSHADLVPTLLGLAGYGPRERERLRARIEGHDTRYALPGADLAPVILGEQAHAHEPDGAVRRAVLFVTDDCITEPLPDEVGNADYQYFLQRVAELADGREVNIRRGVVVQPCHVQCVRSREWKLARYWDPRGNAADQWELYAQAHDPDETVNLVRWTERGEPVVRADAIPRGWRLPAARVEAALVEMLRLLDEARTHMLSVDDAPRAAEYGMDGRRRVPVGAGFVVASRLEPGVVAL